MAWPGSGLATLQAVEDEWRQLIGAEDYDRPRSELQRLNALLSLQYGL